MMAHIFPSHLFFVTTTVLESRRLRSKSKHSASDSALGDKQEPNRGPKVRKSSGAQGRDRTTDTVIFSHVLYQLSYLGAEPAERRGV
jgi:hypothetical protein